MQQVLAAARMLERHTVRRGAAGSASACGRTSGTTALRKVSVSTRTSGSAFCGRSRVGLSRKHLVVAGQRFWETQHARLTSLIVSEADVCWTAGRISQL